jgi:hypothetical protein
MKTTTPVVSRECIQLELEGMLTEDKHHQVAEAQKTWDCFRLVAEA